MTDESSTPRKRGRPRKSELKAKAPGGRGQVGRPKGDAAILNEYRSRMLASPKSAAVLEKILSVSLDDEHKHQGVCLKLIGDRLLHLSHFENDKSSKGIGGISINISTNSPVEVDGEVVSEQ